MRTDRPPTPDPPSRTVFIVAGEVSGDMAAASVVTEIRRLDGSVVLLGVGGPRMAAAGVNVLAESSAWSAIGHVDPLLHLPTHLRRLRTVEALIRRSAPALLVLVDFAAFNLRLAERLRHTVPIVYYFPPMVSVRRGRRAAKVARLGMRLLVTLHPEAEAYRAAGADAAFVGHPVVDTVRPTMDPAQARFRFQLASDAPVVGVMPGSRAQEVRAHLPIMLRALHRLRDALPDVCAVLPVPSDDLARQVAPSVAASGLPIRIVGEIHDAMAVADVLIVATGTATLEAAVLGIPMVAVYRLPWLSWVIARRLIRTRYASLPNLLAGREIVPELLQDRMTPGAIADAVAALLRDPAWRAAMRADLAQVAAGLGPPGAAARAAREVLGVLSRAPIVAAQSQG